MLKKLRGVVCSCYADLALLCVVFFFKQKTAYEMRISDWSSGRVLFRSDQPEDEEPVGARPDAEPFVGDRRVAGSHRVDGDEFRLAPGLEIGRASCRERVCQYV